MQVDWMTQMNDMPAAFDDRRDARSSRLALASRVGYLITGLAFLALFAAIATSALMTHASLRDVEQQRARIEEAKVSWIALQAETELYRLALAAERFALSPERHRGALESRLDIYWSRISLLDAVDRRQALSSLMSSAALPSATAILADLAELDALLADRSADPAAVTRAVRDHADRWLPPLVTAARELYHSDLTDQAAVAVRVSDLTASNLRNQLLLAASVLAFGAWVGVMMWRNHRLRRRAETARRALADAMALAPFSIAFLEDDGRLATTNASFAELTAIEGDAWRAGETRADHLARTGRDPAEDPAEWLLSAMQTPLAAMRRIAQCPRGRHMLIESVRHPHAGLAVAVSDVTDFVEARSRAENLLAERAELLAMAGHELRTPISALVGALDMAQASAPDGRDANLAMARRAADQLLSIADDVLEFSSLEDGLFSIRPSLFAPAEHLRTVAASHRPRAEAAGQELRLFLDDLGEVMIRSDRLRLRQVLDNLIVNAIKYAGRGWIEVRAGLQRDGDAGILTLEVEDSGAGVPPEAREALFIPFRRFAPLSDNGRSVGGLGLGLPICKRILEGLSGRITYAEGRTGGALFRAQFPVGVREKLAVPPGADAPPTAPAPTAASCLLVEDDELLAEIHTAQLLRLCTQVRTARSKLDALDLIGTQRFDLIVLDLLLPDGLGSEVAKAVRAREAGGAHRAAVIVLTAYADPAAVEACRQAGVDEVFRKPIDLDRLRPLLTAAAAPQPPEDGRPAQEPAEVAPALASFPGESMVPATWTELTEIVPAARIAGHVRELDAELAAFLAGLADPARRPPAPAAREELAETAHVLAGRAKLLGFPRLGRRLNDLEAACRDLDGEGPSRAIEALLEMARPDHARPAGIAAVT